MIISKGIWIPEELIDENISWTKRILIAEISQLEMLEKGCVASNNHFSNKLKISKQAVSKALHELEKDGYITIDNAQTKRNFGRKITINFSKSAINFSKSGIHQSGESKENKTINKTINIDAYEDFITHLKAKVKTPSKVTSTKQGRELFKSISNKQQLISDYIMHQNVKGEFAQRITSFMEDYRQLSSQPSNPKLMIGGCEI